MSMTRNSADAIGESSSSKPPVIRQSPDGMHEPLRGGAGKAQGQSCIFPLASELVRKCDISTERRGSIVGTAREGVIPWQPLRQIATSFVSWMTTLAAPGARTASDCVS